MRFPGQSRGITPRTCQQCREDHPEEAWCDAHDTWHPRSSFSAQASRPSGIRNRCIDALSEDASRKRGLPPIRCAACGRTRASQRFRGGRAKSAACKECEDSHPGERWCRIGEHWADTETDFGANGRGLQMNCRACRAAGGHGVSPTRLLEIQGVEHPECGACGSEDWLVVDHDHRHCPGASGCPQCVTGWLCHSCNTSEGLLQTSERALALAEWMERQGRYEAPDDLVV